MQNTSQKAKINNTENPSENFTLEISRIISFKPGYRYSMHHHKRIELNYILSGNCIMMLENELVKLNKNSSILIFPGSKHDFYVNSKNGIKILQLEFQIDQKGFPPFNETLGDEISFLDNLKNHSKNYFKIPNNPEIKNCMEKIILENKLKRNHYQSLTKLFFLELIILLSRYISAQLFNLGKTENACLKKAMNIMHSNYCSSVSIAGIASECNITSRYLRKLFEKHLDSSPKEYCNNLKIKKTVELLADQNISIKEIAFSVGYSSPQYFSRMFKEKYGFSPRTYRKILFDKN